MYWESKSTQTSSEPKLWGIFFGSILSKTSLQECLKTKHIPLPIASKYSKTQHLKHHLLYLNIPFFSEANLSQPCHLFVIPQQQPRWWPKSVRHQLWVPPFPMKVRSEGWMGGFQVENPTHFAIRKYIDSNGWIFHCHIDFSGGGGTFSEDCNPAGRFFERQPPWTSGFDDGFFGEVPPEKGDLFFPKGQKKGNRRIGTARFIDI